MADYPSGIYDPRTKSNKSGVEYDPEKETQLYAEDVTYLDNEVVAIETELGLNPRGGWSNVKDRLGAHDEAAIAFIIDGAGTAITTGEKGHLEIPFKCEIERMTILADQSGSIVVDIWKDVYAHFPPTVADSICAAAKPTISSATKAQDDTLTDWTKTINAGDILAYNVDSCATITRVVIVLKVKKVA